MKYFAYVENSNGCDYTMGCNRGLFPLKGKTLEDAVRWFYQNAIEFIDTDHDDYQRYYTDDPGEFQHVMFLETAGTTCLSESDINTIKADYFALKEKREHEIENCAEQAEYKRLKEKFG